MSQKKPEIISFDPPDGNTEAPSSIVKTEGWRDGIDTIHGENYNWLWRYVSKSCKFFQEIDKTFYVDKTSGDDNNDGSSAEPFKTLPKAINAGGNYGNINIVIKDDEDQYISEDIELVGSKYIITCTNGTPGKIIHRTDTSDSTAWKIFRVSLNNASLYILDNPIQIGDEADSGTSDYDDDYDNCCAILNKTGKNELKITSTCNFSDTTTGGSPCCLIGLGDGNLDFYDYSLSEFNTGYGAGGVIIGDDTGGLNGQVDCFFLLGINIDDEDYWSNIDNTSGGALAVSQVFEFPGRVTESNGIPDNLGIFLGPLEIQNSDISGFTDNDIRDAIKAKLCTDDNAPFRGAESDANVDVSVETVRFIVGDETTRIQKMKITFSWTSTGDFYNKLNPNMPFQPIYIKAVPDMTLRRYGLIETQKPQPRGHNIRLHRNMTGL